MECSEKQRQCPLFFAAYGGGGVPPTLKEKSGDQRLNLFLREPPYLAIELSEQFGLSFPFGLLNPLQSFYALF